MIHRYIKQSIRLVACTIVALLALAPSAHATHIVGGDINYRYLGNEEFEIILVIRRDCFLGSLEAEFDDPAAIGIYDQNGILLPNIPGIGRAIFVPFDATDTLNNRIVSDCGFEGEQVCVEETAYRTTVRLPQRPGGYFLGYNRCCRNGSLTNVDDPLQTGASFYTRIEESVYTQGNSSPVFDQWPTVYICTDEDVNFDSRATDPDGDSLVYELFTPFTGGTFDRPKPQPQSRLDFTPIVYNPPFSLQNLLGGFDPLRIDPQTGLISGTPVITGQFLVGVRVKEYRNGVLIGSTNRDFQYNVRVCSQPPLAQFSNPDVICDGLTVDFDNNSLSASDYQWQFDFPTTDSSLISLEEDPTFTFPASGFYDIQLIATRGSDACADTSVTRVGVFERQAIPGFSVGLSSCDGDEGTIMITDLSDVVVDSFNITAYAYTLVQNGDTIRSSDPQPTFTVSDTTFTITQEVFTSSECSIDTTLVLDYNDLLPQVSGSWQVEECLIADSTFSIRLEDLGTYVGTVASVVWDIDNSSQAISVTGGNVVATLTYQSESLIRVTQTVTLDNGCVGEATFTIDPTSDIVSIVWLDEPISACTGDQVRLVANPNQEWDYTWEPINGLSFTTPINQSDPLFVGMSSGVYYVTVTDGECDYTDSIVVELVDQLEIDVTGIAVDCGGGIELTATGGGNDSLYQWSLTADFSDTLFIGNPLATTVTDNDAVYYVRYGIEDCVSAADSIAAGDVLAIADYTFERIDCPSQDSVRLLFTDNSNNGSPGFVPISWSWAISASGQVPLTGSGDSIEVVVPKNVPLEVILQVVYENGCQSTTIDTITPGPYADVVFVQEPAITICTGDSTRIVSNGNLAWTYTWSPTADLNFDDGMHDPLWTGTMTSTYYVTVTDGICTVMDSVRIELADALDIDIEGTQIDCDGTLLLAGVGGANPDLYEWSTSSTFDLIVFTGSPLQVVADDPDAVIYVRYNNGECVSPLDSIRLGDVVAMADFTITAQDCPTESTATIVISDNSATTSPGFTPISWEWMIGPVGNAQSYTTQEVTITIDKDSLIVVNLMVTYENGCTSEISDTLVPGPFANIGFDLPVLQICTGDSVRIVNNPNSDFLYSWDPTTGLLFDNLPDQSDPLFVGNTTTTYGVTVTDGLCTVDTTVTVEIVDQIDLVIDGSVGVCDSDVELTVSGALGAGDYQWSLNESFDPILTTGDTLRTTLPANSTTYYVRYVGPECNSPTDSILLENKDIMLDWIEPFPICNGDSTVWQFFNSDPSQQLTFVWQDDVHIVRGGNTGMPTIVVSPDETEDFDLFFSVVNEFGCELTDTITFTIAERPVLDYEYFTDSCGGTTICFEVFDSIDYNGLLLWNFGDINDPTQNVLGDSTCFTFPDTGTYNVAVWSVSGSCSSDTVFRDITVYPQVVIDPIDDQIVCATEIGTVTPTSNIPGTEYLYCTIEGDTIGVGASVDIQVLRDTSIIVKAVAPDGCTDTAIARLLLYEFDAVVDIPQFVCVAQDTSIMIMSASGNDYSYQWGPDACIISGADTDKPRINVALAKDLSVTITDNVTGCIDSFSYPITVTEFEIDVEAEPDTIINRGEELTIQVVNGVETWIYTWSNGSTDGSQVVMPDSTTTYIVTVTNEDGCVAIDSITITVRQPNCDEDDIFLPTAFSPNGDNVNDVLFVRSNFIAEMELLIYNRWGEEVFFSNDQAVGWDGTFGGETLPPDAYAFALSVICIDGTGSYQTKGNVSILK